jgi:hypothetical protein
MITSYLIECRSIVPIRCLPIKRVCCYRRIRSGTWMGLAAGLSLAFPFTTHAFSPPGDALRFTDWCRPIPDIPLAAIALPCIAMGAFSSLADVEKEMNRAPHPDATAYDDYSAPRDNTHNVRVSHSDDGIDAYDPQQSVSSLTGLDVIDFEATEDRLQQSRDALQRIHDGRFTQM